MTRKIAKKSARSADKPTRGQRQRPSAPSVPALLGPTPAREVLGTIAKMDHADEIIASWRRELPEITGVTLEVCKRTARLSTLMDEVLGVELAKLGLTRAEYAVLATLRRVGEPYRLRPTELATSLQLSSGGMSNVIKRIVDAGYVSRSGDPSDGRSSCVELSPEGVVVAETAVRRALAAHKALLDRVPKAKVRALSDLLREILLSLGDGASGQLRSA